MTILPILAEGAAPAGGGGGIGMFVPMILIMVMFYFILIRPQRKQQKQQEEMRKNIGKGDKVVTIGGIHGLVTGHTDRTVSVKVADGLSIKFDRSAIASIDHKEGSQDNDTEEESSENDESEES
jgi:preprotein translocase subunit YajC